MSWRIVYIESGEYIKLRLNNLILQKDEEEFEIPLDEIDSIIIVNNRANITFKLLNKISEKKINFIICDNKGIPSSVLYNISGNHISSQILKEQITWSKELRGNIWKLNVKWKIENQIDLLRYLEIESEKMQLLEDFKNNVEIADVTNREGHASKVYFNLLFGKDFKRREETTINISLNFGYSIIRSAIARTIVAKGLNPSLGFFHTNKYNYFSLADDLIEVFRPFVDLVVYKYIRDKDYISKEDKIMLINILNGKCKINKSYQTINNSIKIFIDEIIKMIKSGIVNEDIVPIISSFQEYEL